ncbi:helix-turn-helix transcriptional regulator [Oscillospiraceae bacterium MB08-C2-2]|nr:helix-turn-helix transcriptional regulator [Oscillospiraceae bacterium MB08-C2-2]
MYEINNEQFGSFVAELRKQKSFTQKELAQRLFVSDKAVSKWERGLSMPDISLLMPLADLLGVTIAELLSGQHISQPEVLDAQTVEKLVAGTIGLSVKEQQKRRRHRRQSRKAYLTCGVIAVLECVLLLLLGYSPEELMKDVFLVESLSLLFGGWFCLWVKDILPAYYDENKISSYSDGVFRMNLAGVYFNNSNWPYILKAGRRWVLGVMVIFPFLYAVVKSLFPTVWEAGQLFFVLTACLGCFVPMILAAKRHG